MASFRDTQQCQQTSHIDLQYSIFNSTEITQLLQLQWPPVWRLNICQAYLDNASLRHLVSVPRLQLRSLSISVHQLDSAVVTQLLQAHWPLLTKLQIGSTTEANLDDHEVASLMSVYSSLTSIEVSSCEGRKLCLFECKG